MSRLSRLKKSNYNNVLYIKEKYKIVDDLEQISFLLNILQKEQVCDCPEISGVHTTHYSVRVVFGPSRV